MTLDRKTIALTCALVLLSGCATWSTASVNQSGSQQAIPVGKTDATRITITENDISDRKYKSLGDISVTVNKTTIFHKDPTRTQVNDKLREKASELGADAVILVRYGKVGASALSWGSLEGKGRAVKF